MNPVRPPHWYYCYVLNSNRNGKFYTGVAKNLELRLEQHNKGFVKSTRYMMPLKLIYFEAYLDKNDAYRREKYLKSGMGKRDLKNRLKGGLTG
ncbi:MAG: GIY-YIG nuclease family protein [Candidatus Omnitrophica bacterium]|nr:GIY-YIG nuclease family protein [Candidatus Omnitrophota bacterium]